MTVLEKITWDRGIDTCLCWLFVMCFGFPIGFLFGFPIGIVMGIALSLIFDRLNTYYKIRKEEPGGC